MFCQKVPMRSLTTKPFASIPSSRTHISLPTTIRQHHSSNSCIRQKSIRPILHSQCVSLHRLTPRQARLSSTATSADVAAAAGPASNPAESLTWNNFLRLRKVRRRINVVASIAGVAACISGSVYLITTHDVETLASQYLGIDSMIMMAIIVVGTTASGWLIGPFFGNFLFNLRHRSLRGRIMEKEKEFFARIKKHRVDPTRSSYQNPVPDYYGEKIGSVQDYRRWLKDQRAFNLKRERMV